MELAFIVEQLSDFYEPQEARLWILSRQRLLEGRVPAEMIQEGNVDEVLTAISQLRDGVFI